MRICLSRFLIFFHTSTVITKPPKYLAPKIWRRKNVLNIANIFTPIFCPILCFMYKIITVFRLFPQIVLVGSHRLELEHIPTPESLELASAATSNGNKFRIRLHESQWRMKNRLIVLFYIWGKMLTQLNLSSFSPQVPLTRAKMMIALRNVQGVYVRATYK